MATAEITRTAIEGPHYKERRRGLDDPRDEERHQDVDEKGGGTLSIPLNNDFAGQRGEIAEGSTTVNYDGHGGETSEEVVSYMDPEEQQGQAELDGQEEPVQEQEYRGRPDDWEI